MLMEFGSVTVPNVGTWTLNTISSQLALDKQSIQPPKTHVSYDRIEDSTNLFSSLLIESGCDADMAKTIELWFVQDWISTQNSSKVFPLYGLGKVINNTFIPDDDYIFDKYAGLDSLPVKIVPKKVNSVQHNDDYLFRLNNPYFEKEPIAQWKIYLWPILISLFVLGFVITWWSSFDISNKNISTKIEPTSKTEVNLSDTIVVSDSLKEDTASTQIDEKKTVVNDSDHKADETSMPSDKRKQLDEKSTSVNPSTLTYKECVLVLGSFKNQNNANRLINKLKKQGYQHYTSFNAGFQRVGIVYNCGQEDPDDFKNKMRQKMENQAWNLHDTL